MLGSRALGISRRHTALNAAFAPDATQFKLALPARTLRTSICWERWELKMLEEEMNSSQVANDEEDWVLPTSSDAASSYYSHWDNPASHLPYIEDEVLISSFRQAIKISAPLIRDKVVLDLGCGPGAHLAMMCAQAGAHHVYAVEGSEGAAASARQVILANGLSSKITVLHANVESLRQLPKGEKADVIVSDCVGPMLLGGGMLRGLALAKRNLMKPGGLVLPDFAELHVAGVDDRDFLSSSKQRWESAVPGFDLSPVMTQVVRTPRFDTLSRPSQLFTDTFSLARLNLGVSSQASINEKGSPDGISDSASAGSQDTVPISSLTLKLAASDGFVAPFELRALREERLFALMLWFDTTFTLSGQSSKPIIFSCGPNAALTHQQQLFLNFPKSIRLAKDDVIQGTISWRPDGADSRGVRVELELEYKGVVATASYFIPEISLHGPSRDL